MTIHAINPQQPIFSATSSSAGKANTENRNSFAEAMNTVVTSTAPVENSSASQAAKPDFSNMTRKEIFDWMNDQLSSGKMTLDESTVYLGMTIKIDAVTGIPVDMETDTSRYNFMDKAQQGLEGAIWRKDYALAERIQKALNTMQEARQV